MQEKLNLFARLRSQFKGPPLTSAEIIAAIDRDSHPPVLHRFAVAADCPAIPPSDGAFLAAFQPTTAKPSNQLRKQSRSGPALAMAQAPSWLGSGWPAQGSR